MKQFNLIFLFFLAFNYSANAQTIEYKLEASNWSRQPAFPSGQQRSNSASMILCPETLVISTDLVTNSNYSISTSIFSFSLKDNFINYDVKNIDSFASTILRPTPGHFAGLPFTETMNISDRKNNNYILHITRQEGLFNGGSYSTWGGPMAWSITIESNHPDAFTPMVDSNKKYLQLNYVFHDYSIREDFKKQSFYTNAKYFANCTYLQNAKN